MKKRGQQAAGTGRLWACETRDQPQACGGAAGAGRGFCWEGWRQVLAAEMAPQESAGHWREFPEGLLLRGLRGVRGVVSDDPSGLRRFHRAMGSRKRSGSTATPHFLHFLCNALNHLPGICQASAKTCRRAACLVRPSGGSLGGVRGASPTSSQAVPRSSTRFPEERFSLLY